MSNTIKAETPTVFVVDDEPDACSTLSMLLEHEGYRVQSYADGQAFLENASQAGDACCAILDVNLPDMSGISIQHEMVERGLEIPIVFLTGYGTVSVATTGLKAGAVDFIEKGSDLQRLMEAVREGLHTSEVNRKNRQRRQELDQIFSRLTPRESEIVAYLIRGLTAKEIGRAINISPRTAEIHRSRILEKLAVKTVAELVSLTIEHTQPTTVAASPPYKLSVGVKASPDR